MHLVKAYTELSGKLIRHSLLNFAGLVEQDLQAALNTGERVADDLLSALSMTHDGFNHLGGCMYEDEMLPLLWKLIRMLPTNGT